jgi:group I intron endonuclease
MKSKITGIYLITSKINNKKYVGQAVDITKRWQRHLQDLKANRHPNKHLQRHFNKYLVEDLTFEILEEVTELNLLTEREQHYMNLLKPEFNQCLAAGSCLGLKKEGAKYYSFDKDANLYTTHYSVKGNEVSFSYHKAEEAAIKEVEYIKSLTDDELLKYKQECMARPKKRSTNCKNYIYSKQSGKFRVQFKINGKQKQYGFYATEQEAIDRVKQVRLELGIN